MNRESPQSWPLRPSHAAAVSHALCMALSDLVHHEGGGEISRRRYLQLCGLATAAEVFAREASRFFGSQPPNWEAALEALEDEWVEGE